jgi:hypothetical protein
MFDCFTLPAGFDLSQIPLGLFWRSIKCLVYSALVSIKAISACPSTLSIEPGPFDGYVCSWDISAHISAIVQRNMVHPMPRNRYL